MGISSTPVTSSNSNIRWSGGPDAFSLGSFVREIEAGAEQLASFQQATGRLVVDLIENGGQYAHEIAGVVHEGIRRTDSSSLQELANLAKGRLHDAAVGAVAGAGVGVVAGFFDDDFGQIGKLRKPSTLVHMAIGASIGAWTGARVGRTLSEKEKSPLVRDAEIGASAGAAAGVLWGLKSISEIKSFSRSANQFAVTAGVFTFLKTAFGALGGAASALLAGPITRSFPGDP